MMARDVVSPTRKDVHVSQQAITLISISAFLGHKFYGKKTLIAINTYTEIKMLANSKSSFLFLFSFTVCASKTETWELDLTNRNKKILL
jgi:hypothetical protein